jgi:hypothetical protein
MERDNVGDQDVGLDLGIIWMYSGLESDLVHGCVHVVMFSCVFCVKDELVQNLQCIYFILVNR